MAGIRLAEVGSASNDRSERTFESCLTIVASKQRDTFHDWLIAQSACRLGIERGRPRDGSVGSSAMRARKPRGFSRTKGTTPPFRSRETMRLLSNVHPSKFGIFISFIDDEKKDSMKLNSIEFFDEAARAC